MMELARSAFPACRPLELPFRSLCTQQGPPFLCHAHAPLDVQDGRIQHVSAFWTKLRVSACATALAAAALVAAPTAAMASDTPLPSDSLPVLDLARVVPSGKVDALQQRLRSLEDDTGWRVRMLTRYGPSDTPTIEEIRKGWHVDGKTIVILVDPTAPNIMSFRFGDDVQRILRRPFFTELQSRYGNLYAVRERGEEANLEAAIGALDVCLRKGGCAVPPGLPSEQYYFTLGTSIAGGLVLGAVLRLDPVGFVQRRWVWGLLFAPLWGTLAINFGIAPVISRTDDVQPVLANIAATVAAASLIYWYPQAAQITGLTVDTDDEV